MSDTTISLKIVIDGKEAIGTLGLTEENLKKLSAAFKGMGESAQSQFDKFGGRIVAINQGLEAVTKAAQVLSKPIEIAANFEKYNVQFEVLLGSADAAQKRIKELAEFANTTPFELPEVVKASKLLQTFGGNALATGANLTMVGDMAAASGAQFDEIAMWVGRANTAIMSGREWGEAAMRMQELGLMSGKTRQELEDLTKSGASGDVIWKKFSESMSGFSGMMEKQSKTFDGMLSSMKDSFSMLAADVGNAFLPLMKDTVEMLTRLSNALKDIPGSIKVAGAAVAGIIGTFALFNSSISPSIYGFMALAGAVTSLYMAFRNGESSVMIIGGALGLVSGALIGLRLNAQLASVSLLTKLVPSLTASAVASQIASGAIGLVIAGLAVLAVSWYEVFRHAAEWQEKFSEAYKKGEKEAVDQTIEEYRRLSREKRMLAIGELDDMIKQNEAKLSELKKSEPQSKSETAHVYAERLERERRAVIEQQNLIKSQKSMLKTLLDTETKMRIDEEKKANEGKAALSKKAQEDWKKAEEEAANLRIANIADERERAIKEIEARYKKQEEKFGTNANWVKEATIRKQKEIDDIKKKFDEKEAEDREKSAGEIAAHQTRLAEIEADGVKASIDIDEKRAMATATTEAERLRITKDFAIKRIEAEAQTQLKILEIEQAAAEKIADPVARQIKTEEISNKAISVTNKANSATETVNTTYNIGVDKLTKDLSVSTGNADIKAEQDRMLAMLANTKNTEEERQRIIEESEKRIADIKQNAQLKNLEAEKKALMDSYKAHFEAGTLTAENEDELRKKISAIEVQIGDVKVAQAKRSVDASEKEKKERTIDAKDYVNKAVSNLSNIYDYLHGARRKEIQDTLDAKIENLNADRESALSKATTQEQKDAINRDYAAREKSLRDQANEEAKAANSELFTIMKAGNIAEAIINTYTGATAALKMGPFGIPLAAVIIAAGLANVAKITETEPQGLATGGPVSGPGGPTDDKIPAMLSNGEYVINAKSTEKYLPIVQMINEDRVPSARDDDRIPKLTSAVDGIRKWREKLESISMNGSQFVVGDMGTGIMFNSIRMAAGEVPKFASGGLAGKEIPEMPLMNIGIDSPRALNAMQSVLDATTFNRALVDAAKEILISHKKAAEGGSVSNTSSTVLNNSMTRSFTDYVVNNKYASGGLIGKMPDFSSIGFSGLDMPSLSKIDFRMPSIPMPSVKMPDVKVSKEMDITRIEKLLQKLVDVSSKPLAVKSELKGEDIRLAFVRADAIRKNNQFSMKHGS